MKTEAYFQSIAFKNKSESKLPVKIVPECQALKPLEPLQVVNFAPEYLVRLAGSSSLLVKTYK